MGAHYSILTDVRFNSRTFHYFKCITIWRQKWYYFPCGAPDCWKSTAFALFIPCVM